MDDKHKFFRLIKKVNNTLESGTEPVGSKSAVYQRSPSMDIFLSSELQRNLSSGIFDVHAIDDMELLSEPLDSTSSTRFEEQLGSAQHLWEQEREKPSNLFPAASLSPPRSAVQSRSGSPVRETQDSRPSSRSTSPARGGISQPASSTATPAKERDGRNGNLARIKVVVRKRPLNRKEISRKEEDVIFIDSPTSLVVHEPKLKVDLTKYVEKHEFTFDAVLDEDISNNEVYRETVEPIVPSIFEKTKATCFAYGQTGSGKTYTMQPLPLRAAQDMVDLLQLPQYRAQNFQLWVSFFEIYGGKVYDLLNDRRKLEIREDRRQQVCIVGIKEHRVEDVSVVKEHIERGGASRSTGSTGANEESSRSHAILQLVVKKHKEPERVRSGHRRSHSRTEDSEEAAGRMVGKFSFIDLAGSERGADTTDNDKQTRMEGAEINKSLLALKECIRALDHEASHIPFRGSKLTEVLRDSFVGNSRTVMVSCISPGSASVEHTLNTLRYADRVKGLSRSGSNSGTASVLRNSTTAIRESLSTPLPPPPPRIIPPEGLERVSGNDAATAHKSRYDTGKSGGTISSTVDTLEAKLLLQSKALPGPEMSNVEASEAEQEGGAEGSDRDSYRGPGLRSAPRSRRTKADDGNGEIGGRGGEGRMTRSKAAAATVTASETGHSTFAPIPGWPVGPESSSGLSLGYAKVRGVDSSAGGGAQGSSAVSSAIKAPLPGVSLLKPPSGRGGLPAPHSGAPGGQTTLPGPPRGSALKGGGSFPASQASPSGRAAEASVPLVRSGRGSRSKPLHPSGDTRAGPGGRAPGGDEAGTRGEGLSQVRRELSLEEDRGQMEEREADNRQEQLTHERAHKESSSSRVSASGQNSILGRSMAASLVQDEEGVIIAHRKHIEETMELVRQEMKLLAELDQPTGQMQHYVMELSTVLARKASGIAGLQAQLATMQRHFQQVAELS